MKTGFLAAVALCGVLLASACSATASESPALTLQGKLVLKGSMPRPAPVLVTGEGRQWELQGVAPEAAEALQGQQVRAEGDVVRTAEEGRGLLLPALRVLLIAPAR